MSSKIDLLSREKFVENVVQLVNQLSINKKGCCFAIEGGWGVGKTFVIEKVEEKLRLMQSEETNNDRYFLFHYNCWQHDYYQEPAVAIISAMLSSIQEDDSSGTEIEDSVKSGYKVVRKKLGEIAVSDGTLWEAQTAL